jgi:hypothetical protein
MGRKSRQKREQRQADAGKQFRAAMREVESEDRTQAVAELERIAEQALGVPLRGCKASVFVLRSASESPWPRCQVCGESTRHIVAWKPDEESCRRDFGLDSDEVGAVLYPLCGDCCRKCQEDQAVSDQLEESILRDLRSEGHIRQWEANAS